jgi:hypothetical protein
MAIEKDRTKKFPLLFFSSWIRDPRSGMGEKIRIWDPGSTTLMGSSFNLKFLVVMLPKHTPRLSHDNV